MFIKIWFWISDQNVYCRWRFAMNIAWSLRFTNLKNIGLMSFPLILSNPAACKDSKWFIYIWNITNTSWMRNRAFLHKYWRNVQSLQNSLRAHFAQKKKKQRITFKYIQGIEIAERVSHPKQTGSQEWLFVLAFGFRKLINWLHVCKGLSKC